MRTSSSADDPRDENEMKKWSVYEMIDENKHYIHY